jgi:GNAT superfamily N-acetyltransferase
MIWTGISDECYTQRMIISPMRRADLPHLVKLCAQLGYETDLNAVAHRYTEVVRHPEHALLVAVENDIAVAFLHARVSVSFARDTGVEVAAIVVEESRRGKGIGKLLMKHAEAWAREQGYPAIFLRSNEIREEAHKFYEGLGYANTKKSVGFLKQLNS